MAVPSRFLLPQAPADPQRVLPRRQRPGQGSFRVVLLLASWARLTSIRFGKTGPLVGRQGWRGSPDLVSTGASAAPVGRCVGFLLGGSHIVAARPHGGYDPPVRSSLCLSLGALFQRTD